MMFIYRNVGACFLVLWMILIGHFLGSVEGKLCYFNQEPDESGKLHWINSFELGERCSCSSLRPGGVTMFRQEYTNKQVYTVTPLFTDDHDAIREYFDCQEDYVPVSIACPASISEKVTRGNFSGAVITWAQPNATESSGVPPIVTLLSTKANGSFFPFGIYTISYKAVDLKNNNDTCEFTVTVDDGVKPQFTNCPLNINKIINRTSSVVVEWVEPIATDNSGVQPTVVIETPASGSNFTEGTHIVTYRATDGAGNRGGCTFNVIIAQKPVDVMGKLATQSTSYGSAYLGDKAIDGNIYTFNHNNYLDPHPWWKVDLVDNYCLGTVSVTVRIDCCGYRFIAATVRAGVNTAYSENQQCGLPATAGQSQQRAVVVFDCNPPVVARYVSIEINITSPDVTDGLLQLAEVTIEEATTEHCK